MIIKKIESAVFYLLIFSVPIQARLVLHSWTKPFNQWTSAYLYGTDLLLGALFILWLINHREQMSLSKSDFDNLWQRASFWLALFFAISILSTLDSRILELSFYQLLKLAEFIGFYFYLRASFGRIFDLSNVMLVIIASGFFQSLVAIIQYVKQGSVGLRLLGESPLSVNAIGAAVFIADGIKYLRAYGTTPHPNILAAWLFLAIFAFYYHYLGDFAAKKDPRFRALKEGLALIIYGIILFAFFATFSRTVVGIWLLGMITRLLVVIFKKDIHKMVISLRWLLFQLVAVTCVVIVVFSLLFWPQIKSRIHISSQEEAFTQRVFYNKFASSVTAGNPLLGVGIGQFVPDMMTKLKRLPSVAYQPVHNIYLLMADEVGLLGLATFLLFLIFILWKFFKNFDFRDIHSFSFLIMIISFLIIGFFDHFLWTSQQGGLVFWIVFALLGMSYRDVKS